MKTEILKYDDLTEDEKEDAPNNGRGKEYAHYLKVTYPDGSSQVFSDAMEPEDARFVRDLDWIAPLVLRAYKEGRISGLGIR